MTRPPATTCPACREVEVVSNARNTYQRCRCCGWDSEAEQS